MVDMGHNSVFDTGERFKLKDFIPIVGAIGYLGRTSDYENLSKGDFARMRILAIYNATLTFAGGICSVQPVMNLLERISSQA